MQKLKYEFDDYCITASTQNGDIIGRLYLDYNEDEDQYLMTSIDVKAPYRRNGIGSRLILTAVENLNDDFKICNLNRFSEKDHSSTLTDDGACLVKSCFKKGIITHDNLIEYGAVDIQVPVIESNMQENEFNDDKKLGLYEPEKSRGRQMKLTEIWKQDNGSDSGEKEEKPTSDVNFN